MNGILAATDLVLMEPVSPEVARYLKIVQSSSTTLLAIINDILDYSRIEAGQLELRTHPFRLDELLERVKRTLIVQAMEKEIELQVDLAAGTPLALEGDALRLQQILINLVGNAVKFTGSGGVIRVHGGLAVEGEEEVSEDDIRLVFTVQDTGVGIAPECLATLFEPFSQGGGCGSSPQEGTGLGLNICREFVTMMNGSIGVHSIPGQGSTFSFTVQLARGETVDAIPADLRGLPVLVVDDNRTNRQLAEAILAGAGMAVTLAKNGEEAVEAVLRSDFSVVLMDIQMPGMDGYETCREIRRRLGGRALPVIAMTAHAGDEARCRASGMAAHVAKPLERGHLLRVLSSHLQGGPGRWAGSGEGAEPPGKEDGLSADFPAHPVLSLALELPGIDVEEVLAATGIDLPAYLMVLKTFYDDKQDVAARLRKALWQHDTAQLYRLGHCLKGSSATIGAGELRRLAAELEEMGAADHGVAGMTDLVAAIEEELNRVLLVLGPLFADGNVGCCHAESKTLPSVGDIGSTGRNRFLRGDRLPQPTSRWLMGVMG